MPTTVKRRVRKISKVWKSWHQSCRSIRVFINDVEQYKGVHGLKWCDAMKRHYKERLHDLKQREPLKYEDEY